MTTEPKPLRMDEIKQGHLVLLGTYESTTWVQLFEPSMNFYFRNDLRDFDAAVPQQQTHLFEGHTGR